MDPLLYIKIMWSRYRPGVAQRVGRGIALLFHDRGTRRGWVVSSTPQPQFSPGKDPVPIVLEAGWAPGQVWTGGKSRPHRDSIPDCPPLFSRSFYYSTYYTNIPLCYIPLQNYCAFVVYNYRIKNKSNTMNICYQKVNLLELNTK